MKRALTVDLWDTLIYDLPEVDRARRDLRLTEIGKILYEACGFESEKYRGQMLTAYESSWQRLEAIWQTDQEIVPAEQLKMYLDILFENKVPNNLPEEKLLNAYLEPILDYLPFLMPAAKETLAWLKPAAPPGFICVRFCKCTVFFNSSTPLLSPTNLVGASPTRPSLKGR